MSEVPVAGAQTLRVVIRTRPESTDNPAHPCLLQLNEAKLQYLGPECPHSTFTYDAIFGQQATQDHIFQDVKDVVLSVLHGFNGTICAYGQTGSGKTHTLFGDVSSTDEEGIVPRAMKTICTGLCNQDQDCVFSLGLSVVEIYCERIRDLLDTSSESLQVQQDKLRGVYLANAHEAAIGTEAELISIMRQGLGNRAVAATAMNAGSSRSHCIVMLMVKRRFPDGRCQNSKLCLVDLAGSERNQKSGTVGQTLDEGIQINRSLSALGNVVNALTDSRATHVPYRDSKLTRVLQDSLGGTAKTALIVCCSPCMCNASETLSSLRFGARAMGITNAVQSQACSIGSQDVANLLMTARKECSDLKGQVKDLEALQAKLMKTGSADDAVMLAKMAATDTVNLALTPTNCCQLHTIAAQTQMALICFAVGMLQVCCTIAYLWWQRRQGHMC